MRLSLFPLLPVWLMVAPAPVVALTPGKTLTYDAGTITITTPTPGWNAAGNASSYSNAGTTADGGSWEIYELIPKSETFSAWTRLWALLIERGNGLDFAAEKAAILSNYVPECGEIAKRARVLHSDERRQVLLIPCPSLLRDPGHGQISVMQIVGGGGAWVRMYEEFRVPDYTAGNDAIPERVKEEINLFLNSLSDYRQVPTNRKAND